MEGTSKKSKKKNKKKKKKNNDAVAFEDGCNGTIDNPGRTIDDENTQEVDEIVPVETEDEEQQDPNKKDEKDGGKAKKRGKNKDRHLRSRTHVGV